MMKQQRVVLLVAGLAGALVAAVLLVGAVAEVAAQGPAASAWAGRVGPGRGGPGNFGPGGPGVFGPGGLGLERASLTAGQREQVRAVVDQHRDEIRGLLQRVTAARRALTAAAENGQVEDVQAQEYGAATAALAVAHARVRAEVVQLLTPEQRVQVQKRRDELQQRFSERSDRANRRKP
jgi:Spy/CpxP family protein refolding chaperone